MQEFKSWSLTLATELLMEIIVSFLAGIQTLIETGDLSQAAITALVLGLCTATLRTALKKLVAYVKTLQETN